MSPVLFSAVGLLALASGAAYGASTHAAPELRVEHAAGRLVVIPEARRDVVVTVSGGDARLPTLRVRREEEAVVVEGGLATRVLSCGVINWNPAVLWDENTRSRHPGQRVFVRGVGPLALDHLPVITARVPLDAQLAASDAVWAEVGPSNSLVMAKSGCGAWTIGPVKGALRIAGNGSGDIRGGDVGSVEVALSGSGDLRLDHVAHAAKIASQGSSDIRLTRVGEGLKANVAGSGDVIVDETRGAIEAAIRGSGDVKIAHGRAPSISVNIAGSGDFSFGGEAGSLSAAVAGSGDVSVARVTGPVSKTVAGSGEVHVGP